MHTHLYIIMPTFRTFWTPVRYHDDEMLKEAVWKDGQKISILVELTVCQKNVANALNSVEMILKNKVQFVTFPFFYIVELQNFLNAPRTLHYSAKYKTNSTMLWKKISFPV